MIAPLSFQEGIGILTTKNTEPLFTFDANSSPHRTIFLPFPMVTSLRCSALPCGFMVVSTGPRWFSPRVLEIWNLEIHPFSVSTSLVAFLWCQITSLKLIYQLMVGRWNFLWGLTYFQGLCYFQGGYIQTCFFFLVEVCTLPLAQEHCCEWPWSICRYTCNPSAQGHWCAWGYQGNLRTLI